MNPRTAHRATRVLIAEDERIVAMDLSRRLEGLGYTVVGVVGRGDDAIRAAADELPDIVLMDVHLGGASDGVEAARRIFEESGIPVVFATAYSDVDTLKHARSAHPFGYVLKPFQDDAIQATIEIAVCRWNSELEIKQREELFLATMGAIHEAVIAVDDGLLVTFMNRAAEVMTGWTLNVALTSPIWDVLDLYAIDGSDLEPGQLTDASTEPIQLLLQKQDGSKQHVNLQKLLFEQPGTGSTKTVYLISEAAEERAARSTGGETATRVTTNMPRDLVINEIFHAMMNSFQTVASMLNLRAESVRDHSARKVLLDCRDRVNSLAVLQQKLYEPTTLASSDVPRHLRDIAHETFATAKSAGTRVSIDVEIEDVSFEPDRAVAVGLAMRELITNALKHAFPNGRSGTIRVTLRRYGESLTLGVSDNGVGFDAEEETSGDFGMQFVRLIAARLGGVLSISQGQGSEVSIAFPLRGSL